MAEYCNDRIATSRRVNALVTGMASPGRATVDALGTGQQRLAESIDERASEGSLNPGRTGVCEFVQPDAVA